MIRHIKLEGVDNLRDFGGYATACGRGLKPGMLFRSAAHHQATEEDLAALADLGLQVIVDLRRLEEKQKAPCRRWPAFAAEVIENDSNDDYEGWENMLRDADPTADLFNSKSLQWYATAPFNPRLVDLYTRYFQALGEGRGPALIHCAVGKDRTGLLAAFTHHLAGVHRDDLVDDYLMTNVLDFHEVRLPAVAKLIEKLSGRAPTDEAVRTAMSVRADYLQTALDAVDERYGSLDAYLEQALGVDAAKRAGFEQHYLG